MTEAEFAAWLKDQSAIRCLLVEIEVKVGASVITRYLSNRGYVTLPTETPANTQYIPRITGGIKYTQSMSLDGNVSVSFGDLELDNTDGALDSWLDDYWSNRPLKILLGDVRWPRADFRQMVSGVTVGIDSRNRSRINIKMSDKLQRLNTPVTETTIGGTSQLATSLVPLCFGECHNVEPVLVDPATHKYKVHDGVIEGIIEVRDNGVPVSITPLLSEGAFRLNQAPAGQITCSVQGARFSFAGQAVAWHTGVGQIVYHLATAYGSPTLRFVQTDFDVPKALAFNAAHTQPVGLYIKDRANVLEVITRLADTLGCRLVVDANGKASIVKLDIVGWGTPLAFTEADMKDKTLEVSSLPTVKAAVQLGYCKNWTVQDKLESGIPADHAALYAEEYLKTTAEDTATAANFNLFTEPVLTETLLLTAATAIAEANRRLSLFNVQRKVFKFTGAFHTATTPLGNAATLTASRYGLQAGKSGQVISVATDFVNPNVEIEVLV